jgi:RimJ/RimL family protein N-acetyltransferase
MTNEIVSFGTPGCANQKAEDQKSVLSYIRRSLSRSVLCSVIMTTPYFLESARLGFRVWDPSMEALAMQLWGNEDVTKLIGGPFSNSKVLERMHSEMRNQAESGVQYWPIFDKASGAFVGCCGLRPRESGVYELGFHLVPTAWGKGYALEAAQCVCQYAFTSLSVVSLFAGHNPANLNSRNVLLKLGFTFTHEEFYAPTGLQHPCYILHKPCHEDSAQTTNSAADS